MVKNIVLCLILVATKVIAANNQQEECVSCRDMAMAALKKVIDAPDSVSFSNGFRNEISVSVGSFAPETTDRETALSKTDKNGDPVGMESRLRESSGMRAKVTEIQT